MVDSDVEDSAMFDARKMQQLADAQVSVSDKIRALDRAGVNRADIARFLGKRYQHVRNVLEADKERDRNAVLTRSKDLPTYRDPEGGRSEGRESKAPSDRPLALFRLLANPDGSVLLPRHVVEAFGAAPGEVLIAVAAAGELILRTPEASVVGAQELVRTLIAGEDSLAESLIEDRRREVEHERRNG
jgi:hypothetical protein